MLSQGFRQVFARFSQGFRKVFARFSQGFREAFASKIFSWKARASRKKFNQFLRAAGAPAAPRRRTGAPAARKNWYESSRPVKHKKIDLRGRNANKTLKFWLAKSQCRIIWRCEMGSFNYCYEMHYCPEPMICKISKLAQKLAKHHIFADFKITKKLPKNYTKITKIIQVAPLRGAIGIEIVMLYKFLLTFL